MQEVIITITRILSNQHIYLYFTKLILSCLKLTLTLGAVTPTVTKVPQEPDGAKEALAAEAAAFVQAIIETVQLPNINLKEK